MGKKQTAAQKAATKHNRQSSKADKVSKKAGKIYGNDDIDAILADFAEQDRKKHTVQSEPVPEIPARVNAAFLSHPNNDTIILHGGEHFNGNKVTCYKDLFLYNTAKNEYKHITAPNSPVRSGHTGVIVNQDNNAYLYLFAGDFTSPSQLFKHYNDIWVCDLTTYKFEHLTPPNGPSIRSGHRMVLGKRAIYVMGGFYDNHSSIKYFNDFFKFDLDTRKWERIGPGGAPAGGKKSTLTAAEIAAQNYSQWPSARSGFGLIFHESTNSLILYGGYCTATKKNSLDESANVLSDLWQFSLTTNTWSQLKQSGVHTPAGRSACTLFTYQNRVFIFGGVKDVERKIEKKAKDDGKAAETPEGPDGNEDAEEGAGAGKVDTTSSTVEKKKKKKKSNNDDEDEFVIESEFYNELLEYSLKHKRWFKLNIDVGVNPLAKDLASPQSTATADAAQAADTADDTAKKAAAQTVAWNWSSTKQQEEKLKQQQRLLAERRRKLEEEREAELLALVKAEDDDGDSDADLDDTKKITPVNYLWPRRNAMVTVKNGLVYLFGGAFERENIEITLNDLHLLDLKKALKNVDLDKDYTAQQAIQQQTGSLSASAYQEGAVIGGWQCATEADLSKFSWFEEPDNDDDDSDEEEELDLSDDDDEDDEKEKKSRVPSIEGFADAKSYFKSDESFWISEALSTAPDNATDKELRQLGFKLAKQYFAIRAKGDE